MTLTLALTLTLTQALSQPIPNPNQALQPKAVPSAAPKGGNPANPHEATVAQYQCAFGLELVNVAKLDAAAGV